MLNWTYRRFAKFKLVVLVTIIIGCTLSSCQKEPDPGNPPSIMFISGNGFISGDTTIPAGQRLKIGITAKGIDANITYFSVRLGDGTLRILLDSGINVSSFNYVIEVIKTNVPIEKWTFLIMDRNRVKDSLSIKLTKADSSAWGPIITVENLMLGGQENPATGSFYSLSHDSVMNLDQAYANQSLTDIIYYFGQYEATLASPNEAEAPVFFTGPHGISNWTVKNETRYDTTQLSPEAFDKSLNDSLIITAYEPTAGKKKGKYLQPGMIISFRSQDGKLGLIKVNEVTPAAAGNVRLTIKIQQ